MAVKIPREPEVLQEAADLLLRHISPAKVARVLAAWQVGSGDYLITRERLFAGETVQTLAEKIQAFQDGEPSK